MSCLSFGDKFKIASICCKIFAVAIGIQWRNDEMFWFHFFSGFSQIRKTISSICCFFLFTTKKMFFFLLARGDKIQNYFVWRNFVATTTITIAQREKRNKRIRWKKRCMPLKIEFMNFNRFFFHFAYSYFFFHCSRGVFFLLSVVYFRCWHRRRRNCYSLPPRLRFALEKKTNPNFVLVKFTFYSYRQNRSTNTNVFFCFFFILFRSSVYFYVIHLVWKWFPVFFGRSIIWPQFHYKSKALDLDRIEIKKHVYHF